VTPDASAPIVWLGDAPADAEASATLSAWARTRALGLVTPADVVRATLPLDLGIAATVEDLLDSARDALTGRSGAEVDRALGAAQDLLAAHPELPNAAWLMAEVERVRSTRWRRIPPTEVQAAERASSRADSLDGGRMAGAGETDANTAQTATITLQMRSSREAQIWVDGSSVATGVIESRSGPHSIVVTWLGAPIWAAWVEAPAGASTVALSELDPPACSSADLERARLDGDHVDAELAQCTRWVVATRGPTPGSIRLAVCQASRCGPLADWRPSPVWSQNLTQDRERRSGWPSWAPWGLVGAGVAVASGVVVAVALSSSRSAGTSEVTLGQLVQVPGQTPK
jgi:hypothetical protein